MNLQLRSFHKSQYNPSWVSLIWFFIALVLNAYLILYLIIPSPFLFNLEIMTMGYIRPQLFAYLFSLLLFTLIFFLNGINLKSLIRLQDKKASIYVGIAFTILFLLVQLPFISVERLEVNNFIASLIVLTVAAGLEEIIFRAFLLTSLIYLFKNKGLENKSVWMSVGISSVIFSLSHAPYFSSEGLDISYYLLPTLIGILLSWTYIWFNNIILISLLHLLFNLMQIMPIDNKTIVISFWIAMMLILSIYGYRIKKHIINKVNSTM